WSLQRLGEDARIVAQQVDIGLPPRHRRPAHIVDYRRPSADVPGDLLRRPRVELRLDEDDVHLRVAGALHDGGDFARRRLFPGKRFHYRDLLQAIPLAKIAPGGVKGDVAVARRRREGALDLRIELREGILKLDGGAFVSGLAVRILPAQGVQYRRHHVI